MCVVVLTDVVLVHQRGKLTLRRGDLLVGALLEHRSAPQHVHVLGLRQRVQGVRRQHDSLRGQHPKHALLEQRLPDVRVDRRQRVVEQVDVGVGVHCTSERDTLLLATAEVDATLTDFRLIAAGEHGNVGAQLARLQHSVVALLVEGPPEDHIVAQSVVDNPCALRDVGDLSVGAHAALDALDRLDGRLQQAGLSGAHSAHHHRELARRHFEVNAGERGTLAVLLTLLDARLPVERGILVRHRPMRAVLIARVGLLRG